MHKTSKHLSIVSSHNDLCKKRHVFKDFIHRLINPYIYIYSDTVYALVSFSLLLSFTRNDIKRNVGSLNAGIFITSMLYVHNLNAQVILNDPLQHPCNFLKYSHAT